MKSLTEEETKEPDETSCESDKNIHNINKFRQIEETNKHYTTTVKINGVRKEIIFDSGSPITIMPMDRNNVKPTEIQKVTNQYQDVNKNGVKFWEKIPLYIKYQNNKHKMEVLITERTGITPLSGMDCMKTFIMIVGKLQLAESNQSERKKYSTGFRSCLRTTKL